jgi:predicted  nucleic acid-binding Zn-ribbon protein
MSDIESLKSENQKLREYIFLISSEIEFNDRVHEIKQNFKDSPDLERIIVPILDRINKIKSEKSSLATELNLN